MYVVVSLCLFVGGCHEPYDDTELRQQISALEERVAVNEALLKAYSNKLSVVSVEEEDYQFVITFSNNTIINISKIATETIIKEVNEDGDFVYITLPDDTVLTFTHYNVENENYKIYYTTTDGKKMYPSTTEPCRFGAMLISNTYQNGQGVLTFDGEVTSLIGSFDGCITLKTIEIPQSVTDLGGYAFNDCYSLEALYCNIKTPPYLGYHSFKYFKSGDTSEKYIPCKIYVPFESVSAYKNADYWDERASYIYGYNFEN